MKPFPPRKSRQHLVVQTVAGDAAETSNLERFTRTNR